MVLSEHEQVAARVWGSIQGDTALLDGLLMGDFDDFSSAAMTIIADIDELRRAMPLRLVLQMNRLEGMEMIFEWVGEVLRIKAITQHFDRLAGLNGT